TCTPRHAEGGTEERKNKPPEHIGTAESRPMPRLSMLFTGQLKRRRKHTNASRCGKPRSRFKFTRQNPSALRGGVIGTSDRWGWTTKLLTVTGGSSPKKMDFTGLAVVITRKTSFRMDTRGRCTIRSSNQG